MNAAEVQDVLQTLNMSQTSLGEVIGCSKSKVSLMARKGVVSDSAFARNLKTLHNLLTGPEFLEMLQVMQDLPMEDEKALRFCIAFFGSFLELRDDAFKFIVQDSHFKQTTKRLFNKRLVLMVADMELEKGLEILNAFPGLYESNFTSPEELLKMFKGSNMNYEIKIKALELMFQGLLTK